jgi:hypothetical protein
LKNWWREERKEIDGEVNLTKIFVNTFVKVTMLPQYNNNMIIKFFFNLPQQMKSKDKVE